MARRNRHIAIIEKLLTHLKNSKLAYLKASDNVNFSEEKRFYNKQALIRNQIFQQVLIELQILGVSFDDLIISKFNFDQLLVSSIDTFKATVVEKCLEADISLLKLYNEFIDFGEFENSKLIQHTSTIKDAITKNQLLVDSYFYKKQKDSNY